MLEIGAEQGFDLQAIAERTLPQARVTLHRDYSERDRVLEIDFTDEVGEKL